MSIYKPSKDAHVSQPLCYAPWTTLIIHGGHYNCCCFYPLLQENLPFPKNKEQMLDIFNSKGFLNIRRRLVEDDIKNTPCEQCIRQGNNTLYAPDALGDEKASLGVAVASAEAGEIEVAHAPPRYSINTCTDCNLRCIMCYNSALPEDDLKGSLVPHEKFLAMIEDVGLENVVSITAVGGETFLTKDALAIIGFLADNTDADIGFSTNTNGTLLHNHHDLIKRFKRIDLEFSIDGCNENYEKIRRNSSWDRMYENLEWYAAEAAKHPGWRLGINTLVMKTSLPDLADIVKLARKTGAILRVTPIRGDYFEENIFQFPDLLEGVDWEKHFDDAIKEAGNDMPKALESLKNARSALEQAVSCTGRVILGSPELFEQWLSAISTFAKGRAIAFLGRRTAFSDYLVWGRDAMNMDIFISDFGLEATERKFAGHSIVVPEKLAGKVPALVISCKTYEYRKYLDWALLHYAEEDILFLSYWTHDLYRRIEKVVEKLGDTPVVLYAAGGTAQVLLYTSAIGKLNARAFSDGNPQKWGTTVSDLEVIQPKNIPGVAKDVIVLSEKNSHSIVRVLEDLHGDSLTLHSIF